MTLPSYSQKSKAASIRPTAFAATIIGALLFGAFPALAHGGDDITRRTALSAWRFTPDIVIPAALVIAIYAAGVLRRRRSAKQIAWHRPLLFLAGLAVVVLALQSPIDPIAERLFWVHQIQHILLRMLGPMLIALSWPAAALVAGLPAIARRRVLAPVAASRPVKATFAVIGHPAVATALFILALYFWEIPRYHDMAILNEPIHYLMHFTMLLAGLIFWQRIFDQRPAPQGLRYGVRLMMLWLVTLSSIALGSFTTLKTMVLYPAYDVLGRLYGTPALTDEQFGGLIIWIPSAMMCLFSILIIIHWWGRRETRNDAYWAGRPFSNSAALSRPATAAALIEYARPKNRSLATGMTVFVFAVFMSVLLIGELSTLQAFKNHSTGAHAATIDTTKADSAS